ncbi:hypothetical protein FACS1894181_04550 [Bacteroidia bacterium]|nr:hypothetical protein FACS1894181_04550 [Bacteroidia bacterium]
MQLKEHDLFANRYRLEHLLGSGGFSEVWCAEDSMAMDGLKVALKVYDPGSGIGRTGVSAFSSEFSIAFGLHHNNLLTPTHFDVFNQRPYLVLPYCGKGSIEKLVGCISEREAWQVMHDIAVALEYLHGQEPPVIHQDIKPGNIMIGTGKYLLTDFGISMKARNTLHKNAGASGNSTGTLAYMGPERFSKNPLPIKASDIFSLGATMFELVAGDVPFGDHGGILLQKGAVVPALDGHCSEELAGIIFKCLEKEAWNRPTAAEIKTRCIQYLGEASCREERPKVVEEGKAPSSKGAGRATSPYGNERNGPTKRSLRRNIPPPVKAPPPVRDDGWEQEPPYPPVWEDDWRQELPPLPPKRRGNNAIVWVAALIVCILAAAVFIVFYSSTKSAGPELPVVAETPVVEEEAPRAEEYFNNYKLLVKSAANLMLRGDTTKGEGFESFYREALNCYGEALDYRAQFANELAAYPDLGILSQKEVAEAKRDSVMYVFIEYARISKEAGDEHPETRERYYSEANRFINRAKLLDPDSKYLHIFSIN